MAARLVCSRIAVGMAMTMVVSVVSSFVVPLHMKAQSVVVENRPATGTSANVTIHVVNKPLADVLQAIAKQMNREAVLNRQVMLANKRVSLDVHEEPAAAVFAKVLAGTGLVAEVSGGYVVFASGGGTGWVAQGSVAGKIVDAKTRHGLRGATITLVGTNKGTASGDDGGFRIAEIAPGSYTVQVRLLGYVKTTKTVTVADGQATSVEIVLEPSVNALDQVVVTGTVVSTEMRAVPNAMTVITAKDIERRGITKIDQLFRGDVPGLVALNSGSSIPTGEISGGVNAFDQVLMYSRGATKLASFTDVSNGVIPSNTIKTYVDGVEMADSRYLSQIDPQSIERIEILTGPQASTIYGSNAINGVMQIFTKRGTNNRPQLTATLQSGVIQNNFSPALAPQHDYTSQLNGTEGRFSYNAGGSWNYVGAWTPSKQTTRNGAFGGVRAQFGSVTVDGSLRGTWTRNLSRGVATQDYVDNVQTGRYAPTNSTGLLGNLASTLRGGTSSVTVGYTPWSWWTHELMFGTDYTDIESARREAGYTSPSDTLLSLLQHDEHRQSLRYTNIVRLPLSTSIQGVMTTGVDGWTALSTTLTAFPSSLTGSINGISTFAPPTRLPSHNTGVFAQGQLSLFDALFLTYGLRAEWNPNYGDDAEPNFAPRYGLAYARDIGMVTVKLRASYGRSTRPPANSLKLPIAQVSTLSTDWYGPYDTQLASLELGPEFQQGGEGGLELYLGNRGSLVITRYNQTVDGLISAVPGADSVRALQPGRPIAVGIAGCHPSLTTPTISPRSDGYCYAVQQQYLNVGSVRNQGWELQGSVNLGPLVTHGTYSWTKSRVIGITPKYRALLTDSYYRPGTTLVNLPEHTWALGMTYLRSATAVTLNINGIGSSLIKRDAFLLYNRYLRLDADKSHFSDVTGYQAVSAGYVMADVNLSHRLSQTVEGLLQMQNVTDRYTYDLGSGGAVIGRQTKVGVRIRL